MYLDSDAYLDSVDRDHDDHRFAPAYGVKVDDGWLTREGFGAVTVTSSKGWAYSFATAEQASAFAEAAGWTFRYAVVAL
jgi:hypothetical protein